MDKILVVYWFVILTIIMGGVVVVVHNFYSHPYDIRGIEVSLLSQKVAGCISQKGYLNKNLFEKTTFNPKFRRNFLKECSLNFSDSPDEQTEYFVDVNFFDLTQTSKSLFELSAGNSFLESGCKKSVGKEYSLLPKCETSRMYALGPNGKQYLIEITAIIRKVKENVQ